MLDLPPPVEFGLPAKFKEYRPQQLVSIEAGCLSEKRAVAQCLPTGSGKSLNAITQALLEDKRAVYLTATKGLQDQIQREFKGVVADIRGKNAYACLSNPDAFSCEEGAHMNCPYLKSGECTHTKAVKTAKSAQVVLTNYTCYVTNHMGFHKDGPPWGDFSMMICDEGHGIAEEISDCIAVEYDGRDILDILQSRYPNETPDDWAEFAQSKLGYIKRLIDPLAERAKLGGLSTQEARRLMTMKRLQAKLERTAELCGDPDWLVESTQKGYRLEPLWPAPYVERYLLRGIPKVLVTSATLSRKTCSLIGLKPGELDYQDYPSTFPAANSPVYIVPSVRVDHKMDAGEELSWIRTMDLILQDRRDRKGIMHTVSFARGEKIRARSHCADLMVLPNSMSTRDEVERFKKAWLPRILVSPSVGTGYDFPGAECEYQIIAKVPFPDTRSELVSARCTSDPEYQAHLTIQTLEQMVGRGMRSKTDHCENFIVDGHAGWFLGKNSKHLSLSFKRLLRYVKGPIPTPPKSLLGAT